MVILNFPWWYGWTPFLRKAPFPTSRSTPSLSFNSPRHGQSHSPLLAPPITSVPHLWHTCPPSSYIHLSICLITSSFNISSFSSFLDIPTPTSALTYLPSFWLPLPLPISRTRPTPQSPPPQPPPPPPPLPFPKVTITAAAVFSQPSASSLYEYTKGDTPTVCCPGGREVNFLSAVNTRDRLQP